jgi:chemotaxis regulatin CheY-phosphate phosphatase CheZ
MNFSYIDDDVEEIPIQELRETHSPEIDSEFELDERWKNFKIDLDDFRQEYKEISIRLVTLDAEISDSAKKISKLRLMLTQFEDENTELIELIDKTEAKFNLVEKKDEWNILHKKQRAMKAILNKPQTPNKFHCFVCLENDVDTMLNPCGHTMCSSCITKSMNTGRAFVCPACRSNISHRKSMFFIA